MLNVIKSIVITMLSLFVSFVSFIRGPIVVGLIIGASILSFASKVEASPVQGTKTEYVKAQKDVSKGIYVREDGSRVQAPNITICNEYRNTYLKYSNKYGASKGALVWLVIVTRRGC